MKKIKEEKSDLPLQINNKEKNNDKMQKSEQASLDSEYIKRINDLLKNNGYDSIPVRKTNENVFLIKSVKI